MISRDIFRKIAFFDFKIFLENVLEIGTFTGYAALCLAEGLQKDGKLTTLDVNEDLAYLPQKYFAKVNLLLK